jgi:hypothetical protein
VWSTNGYKAALPPPSHRNESNAYRRPAHPLRSAKLHPRGVSLAIRRRGSGVPSWRAEFSSGTPARRARDVIIESRFEKGSWTRVAPFVKQKARSTRWIVMRPTQYDQMASQSNASCSLGNASVVTLRFLATPTPNPSIVDGLPTIASRGLILRCLRYAATCTPR